MGRRKSSNTSLQRLMKRTLQSVIQGMRDQVIYSVGKGQVHIEVIVEKLKRKFGVTSN
jgi:hypothetical protein